MSKVDYDINQFLDMQEYARGERDLPPTIGKYNYKCSFCTYFDPENEACDHYYKHASADDNAYQCSAFAAGKKEIDDKIIARYDQEVSNEDMRELRKLQYSNKK